MNTIRYAVCFLLMLLLLTSAGFAQTTVGFDVDAASALLLVPQTGQVLFEKNVDKQLPPASIAKIMTLLLTMEAIDSGRVSLQDDVRVSQLAAGMGGSQVWLEPGEVFKLEQLMRAIAVPSANDAAVAVAEHVSGSVEAFVDAMNSRARSLGMENTVFTNATGLPAEAGQKETLSTARDIATMAVELLKHPKVLDWTSIRYAVFRENPRTGLWNTNKLIGSYEGADGLKTGYTQEAGYCLVATAERNGLRLLSVVLQTDSELERQLQSERLLDYGFRAFSPMTLVKKGESVGVVTVKSGVPEEVQLVAAADVEVLVPNGRRGDVVTELVPGVNQQAPVAKGAQLGELKATLDGKVLGTVPAVAAEDVKQAGWFTRIWRWIRDLVRNLISFGRS